MKITNPTAKLGEDIATNFLSKNGYKILERNFRKSYGEIDIIAIDFSTGSTLKDQILCFIEVKTRTSNQFGSPLESINYFKLKSIIKTGQFYKLLHPKLPDALRIDAVSVEIKSDGNYKIEIMKNISGF